MIIKDTQNAAQLFAKYDVPMSGYIVNRVIPPELKGEEIPAYLLHRIEMQEKYMDVIQRTFGEEILAFVPEMERDITGLDMIEKMAQAMFGDGR